MIEHVAVVVPARNEGERLAQCLRSIRAAVTRLRAERDGVRVRIVVVLDSCTDNSNAIASALTDVMRVHCSFANVGAARAAGVRWALCSLRGRPERTWIASTDADSEVPETWLVDQVRLAERGWDVTLGGTAGQVHGANLGVRASAYLESGGFAIGVENESAPFVDSLRQLGARIVELDEPPVSTSVQSVRARERRSTLAPVLQHAGVGQKTG